MKIVVHVLLAVWAMLLVSGCAREHPLPPEEKEALELEHERNLYPGGMQSRQPQERRFPGLEPGPYAPGSQRSG